MVGKSSLQKVATLEVIREISDSNLETGRYGPKSLPDYLGELKTLPLTLRDCQQSDFQWISLNTHLVLCLARGKRSPQVIYHPEAKQIKSLNEQV